MTFSALETRGFIVLKSFLDTEDIARAIEEYNQIKVKRGIMQGRCVIMEKFGKLIDKISFETNLKINSINLGAAYFDTGVFTNSWHQDHEPYYKWQNSYDSINLWAPIIKIKSNISGIEIVPFDNLASKISKELLESEFIGKGAKSFKSQPTQTTVYDDEDGKTFTLDFSLSEISEIPEISVGDAIVMRGDLLHKTQDANSRRVAMSIRATNGNGIITKEKFLSGCQRKRMMINANPKGFEMLNQLFLKEGRDTATVFDIMKNL